MPKKIEKYTNI